MLKRQLWLCSCGHFMVIGYDWNPFYIASIKCSLCSNSSLHNETRLAQKWENRRDE